jgi:5-methylcytosine-specific restriction endonuclease McrA
MPPLKVCNDCGQLTRRRSGRCSDCDRQRNRRRDAERGNFRQRGYTAAYDRARAVLVPAAIRRPCPICGGIMCAGQIDVDHVVPLSRGGTNDVANLRAVCRRCNRGHRT